MNCERYGWCPKAEGIIRSMLAKDSHPHAYVFSLGNEKVREIVVRRTTEIKKEIESDERYNSYQQNGVIPQNSPYPDTIFI